MGFELFRRFFRGEGRCCGVVHIREELGFFDGFFKGLEAFVWVAGVTVMFGIKSCGGCFIRIGEVSCHSVRRLKSENYGFIIDLDGTLRLQPFSQNLICVSQTFAPPRYTKTPLPTLYLTVHRSHGPADPHTRTRLRKTSAPTEGPHFRNHFLRYIEPLQFHDRILKRGF